MRKWSAICQPTIIREYTSRMNATYSQPPHVDAYVMSASHNSFGRSATKARLTRSGARAAVTSATVVNRRFPRCTPRIPISRMSRVTVQRAIG